MRSITNENPRPINVPRIQKLKNARCRVQLSMEPKDISFHQDRTPLNEKGESYNTRLATRPTPEKSTADLALILNALFGSGVSEGVLSP